MINKLNNTDIVKARIQAFGKNCSVIDFALDTTIFHLSEEKSSWFIFEFLSRKIIWTNPSQDEDRNIYAQRLTIDWIDQDGYSDYEIVSKFLSALCFFAEEHVLYDVFNVLGPFPGPKCGQKKQFSCLNGYRIDLMIKSIKWSKLTENDWSKLAYYRQGINSVSPYLKFLSFWNIIEVNFKRNSEKIKKYLNKELDKMQNLEDWKTKNKDFYKSLKKARNRCAHVLLNDNPESKMQNPDKPLEYMDMRDNMIVIKELSRKVLSRCLY